MEPKPIYQSFYSSSHALIIGINKYIHAAPLAFATNDAQAVAEKLKNDLDFPKENITLLLDEDATRSNIMASFLRFTDHSLVSNDDRLLIFYAGHGHTATGRRGETGFLVPQDGNVDDLSTLIRWDELTRNADLILAKHIFFLMDACYGGLALTRKTIPAGSMRFLNDMMQRFSRQVLTAGKGDETVSDGDGVRPGHSIFTSYVLEALDGDASATEGVITANGLMAYTYERVGNDPMSQQTPHYGFIEGDGDFIFAPFVVAKPETETDEPILIQTPTFSDPTVPVEEATFADEFKKLLADPSERIRLDDFLSAHLRRAVQAVGLDRFAMDAPYSDEAFAARLKSYEDAIADLEVAAVLLARWAQPDQLRLLKQIFARLAEAGKGMGGKVIWLRLAWYPVFRLMYAAGISALFERRYDSLSAIFTASLNTDSYGNPRAPTPIIVPMIDGLTEIVNNFKSLPGMERRYTARSDYIFQNLQPTLEDILFLGGSYETLFDEFEVLLALVYADSEAGEPIGHVWGPPGRFAWKNRLGGGVSPFAQVVSEARSDGAKWPPLLAGLFNGSLDRFIGLANPYAESLSKMGWR